MFAFDGKFAVVGNPFEYPLFCCEYVEEEVTGQLDNVDWELYDEVMVAGGTVVAGAVVLVGYPLFQYPLELGCEF